MTAKEMSYTREPTYSGDFKSWYWSVSIKDADWQAVIKPRYAKSLIPWDVYWLMSGPLSGIAEYHSRDEAMKALQHGCERFDRGERETDT